MKELDGSYGVHDDHGENRTYLVRRACRYPIHSNQRKCQVK